MGTMIALISPLYGFLVALLALGQVSGRQQMTCQSARSASPELE